MVDWIKRGSEVFRDFTDPLDIDSDPWKVVKSEVRTLTGQYEDYIGPTYDAFVGAAPTIIDPYANQIRVRCPADTSTHQSVMVAAGAQALSEGKRLVLGPGEWFATDTIIERQIPDGVTLIRDLAVEGVGGGRTTIFHGAPGKVLFRRVGNYDLGDGTTNRPKLTVAGVRGENTVTVDDIMTLQAGDYIRIQDEGNTITDWRDGTNICRLGECNRIKSISGTTLTLYGRLEWDYTTSARVRKPYFGGRFEARDLVIRPMVGTDPLDLLGPFQATSVNGVEIEGIDMYEIFQTGISLGAAQDVTIRDIRGFDMGKDTDNGAYVIAMGGGCYGVRVENVYAENCRHLITTVVNSVDSIESAHVDVIGCSAQNCRFTPFDQHPGARNWRFIGCRVWSGGISYGGTNDGTDDSGFQVRGRFTEVIGCTAMGTYRGAYLVFGERNRVIDCDFQNNEYGIEVYRSPNSDVIGNRIRAAKTIAVWVHGNGSGTDTYVYMDGIVVKNIHVSGNPATAAFVFSEWKSTWDIDYGRTLYAPSATTRISGFPAGYLYVPDQFNLVSDGRPNTNTGGLTTKVTLQDVTLAANSMRAFGTVRITAQWTFPSSANTKTMRVEWGAATGGVATINATATNTTVLELTAEIRNSAAGAQFYRLLQGAGGATVSVGTTTKDTTADQVIRFTGQAADAGENVTLSYYRIDVLPRAS